MKWLLLSLIALGTTVSAKEPTHKTPRLSVPSQRFADFQTAEDPSFRRHIIPAFSRLGCSGRECHGSFAGQGDFQLSLFGYDFDHDFKEITSDPDETRIDPEHPEKSLIITKPTMEVSHKGKERIKKGSWEYNMLLKWVTSGAKNDTEKTGEFDRLEVFPKEIVFKKTGEAVQMRVLAHWKDGTVEDVTELTRFRTNDESIADVSDTGLVKAKEKGDTHIVAFYDNGVLPVPVMLPVSKKNGARYPKVATRTKVDELVTNKLRKLGVVPSDVCTDAEFLRRVSLDVAGTLPTPEEITKFLADKSPGKRVAKIDELLDSPGYAAWWTTLLCDYTGNNPQQLNDAGGLIRNLNGEQSRRWYEWIYKRVANNTPYDELSAGIVLATSRTSADQTYEEMAQEMAAYYRADNPVDFAPRPTMPYFWARRNVGKPEEKALAFAHTWLGVRIECAQCHKHPFDQWTKQDFEQFQVFFNSIAHGQNRAVNEEGITYASLTEDIKVAMANEQVGKSSGDAKKDANKLHQQEALRRIRAGELAPWNEVYIDAKRNVPAKTKKKQEGTGSSRVFTPKILGGEEVMLNDYADPRQPLMDWMRDPENPYFARAFVNRVWAAYFGRGIVEPADDMNLANPPVNAELLDYLAKGFVEHKFNMKWLHREILNSDAYQRTWRPNETNGLDEKNFSRMVLRRLPAEVALDAVSQATATSAELSQFASDIEKRAIGPSAGANTKKTSNYALSTFGRPARVANCDCERTADPTLLQTLFTRNDPELISRLESGKGGAWIDEVRRTYQPDNKASAALEAKLKKVQDMVRDMQTKRDSAEAGGDNGKELKYLDRQLSQLKTKETELLAAIAELPKPPEFNADSLIHEVFLRTVSRPPTAEEITKAREDIAAASNPVNGLKDLLWAMLNTREFMVNH
jgi:hypothetical protein